jgi:hypothetical protein
VTGSLGREIAQIRASALATAFVRRTRTRLGNVPGSAVRFAHDHVGAEAVACSGLARCAAQPLHARQPLGFTVALPVARAACQIALAVLRDPALAARFGVDAAATFGLRHGVCPCVGASFRAIVSAACGERARVGEHGQSEQSVHPLPAMPCLDLRTQWLPLYVSGLDATRSDATLQRSRLAGSEVECVS